MPVLLFFILWKKKLNFKEAKEFVKNIRKIVEPNSGFEMELNRYYDEHIANDKSENNENNNINEIKENWKVLKNTILS